MPSVLNNITAHAKAHHDSVNAAYSAVYSPRRSYQSSSRKNSTTSQEEQQQQQQHHQEQEHPLPPTNLSKAWTSLKKTAKTHHEGVNAAYNAMYAPGVPTPSESRVQSAASSRRHSVESHVAHEDEVQEQEQRPTNFTKAWRKVKGVALEHHRSVNAAYKSAYGY